MSELSSSGFSAEKIDNNLVEEVKIALDEIDNSELTEHATRFENLHVKLQEALNSIDGL